MSMFEVLESPHTKDSAFFEYVEHMVERPKALPYKTQYRQYGDVRKDFPPQVHSKGWEIVENIEILMGPGQQLVKISGVAFRNAHYYVDRLQDPTWIRTTDKRYVWWSDSIHKLSKIHYKGKRLNNIKDFRPLPIQKL